VQLTLTPSQRSEFTLYLRIPAWVSGAKLALNGTPQAGVKPGEYLPLRRSWKSGDSVTLNFSMDAEVVASNPRVAEDRGRVAVRRGPVIFRAEELDHRKGVALADLAINLDLRTFQHEYKPDFLDGVMVLHHRGGRSRFLPPKKHSTCWQRQCPRKLDRRT
jgi:uncharacterized protein